MRSVIRLKVLTEDALDRLCEALNEKGVTEISSADIDKYWAESMGKDTMLSFMPIGYIYMSKNSTSPAELFGGSWKQLTDVFLRAANDSNTGGADSITLTVSNIPRQTGTVFMHGPTTQGTQVARTSGICVTTLSVSGKYLPGGSSTGANSVGNFDINVGSSPNTAIDILPSYQDVYCWERIA